MTNQKWGLPLFVFCLSLILFFALRLFDLTRIPVFVDEAIYIRWSQVMRNEPTLRFLPLSDGKQPLFMWVTIPFLKIVIDPLVAGRAVSILAGFITLASLSGIVLVITNSLLLSAITALVYSVVPFFVFFDRLALADGLLSAFGSLSLLIGILLIKKPRLDLALLLGFSIGLGLLTKSPAIFFYIWQLLLLFVFFDFRSSNRLVSFIKLLAFWLVALILSQIIYNILRLGPNFHLVNSRNQDYLFSLSEVAKHPLNPLSGNLKSSIYWIWFLFTPALIPVMFASFYSKYRKLVTAMLLLSASPLLLQGLVAKVYTSRYILFATAPLTILVSLGIWVIATRLKKRLLVVLLFLVWPLVMSIVLITNPQKANLPFDMRSGYLEEWTAGWGQREVATYLIKRSSEGETAIVGTDGYFGTLPDGLQIYTQGDRNITVIGGSPSISEIPLTLSNSLNDKKNTVYLVANKSRVRLSESELSRLDLIAEYPKPARLDGTHESLLFWRLVR